MRERFVHLRRRAFHLVEMRATELITSLRIRVAVVTSGNYIANGEQAASRRVLRRSPVVRVPMCSPRSDHWVLLMGGPAIPI